MAMTWHHGGVHSTIDRRHVGTFSQADWMDKAPTILCEQASQLPSHSMLHGSSVHAFRTVVPVAAPVCAAACLLKQAWCLSAERCGCLHFRSRCMQIAIVQDVMACMLIPQTVKDVSGVCMHRAAVPQPCARHTGNMAQVATLIAETFADMIFRGGDVHCDPHAANMLVRRVGGGGGSPGSGGGGSTAQRVSASLDGSSAIEQQLQQRVWSPCCANFRPRSRNQEHCESRLC